MEVIYPQETLDLLAKYDVLMNVIADDYQHVNLKDRQRAILEDSRYQACIHAKAKIISLSTCTYLFDANEIKSKM